MYTSSCDISSGWAVRIVMFVVVSVFICNSILGGGTAVQLLTAMPLFKKKSYTLNLCNLLCEWGEINMLQVHWRSTADEGRTHTLGWILYFTLLFYFVTMLHVK
jgi:hypothetical protein